MRLPNPYKEIHLNAFRSGSFVLALMFLCSILVSSILCSPIQSSTHSGSDSTIDPIAPISVPFDMPQLQRPVFPPRTYSIVEAGAIEGGTVKCTQAILSTIEKAAKAGGGTVLIPKGRWLTGAIRLDNNINLRLEKDAVLLFSQDTSDYLPVVFSRHEDVECYKYSAFIYAEGKENIAITGEGTLDGQGKPWWIYKTDKKEEVLYALGNKNIPVNERIFDGKNGQRLRPAFFQPMNCKNILVEGVTFKYGAFWTITPTYCENIIVRKIRIETEGEYGHTPNGDGVDPSSSRNVLIEDCIFDTGDDCIAIKAGRDNDGLRVNRPTENIVVRNCIGLRGHGGIVIGSETSGSIRNIYAENCQFNGTDRIIRLKTARGRGGVLENMWFKNMSGDNIQLEAIHLNMLYTGKRLPEQPVSATTPRLRNIHFDGITCTSGKSYAIEILGLPEMLVENISFNNIVATSEKGVNISDAKDIQIMNSSFTPATYPVMKITDGREILISSLQIPTGAETFLKVEGAASKNIKISKSNISDKDKAISLGEQVSPQAVKVE